MIIEFNALCHTSLFFRKEDNMTFTTIKDDIKAFGKKSMGT